MKKSSDDVEQEANLFAVLLLVPGHLLRAELDKKPLDMGDDTRFKELCKTFGVSGTTMMLRLAHMKL